MKWSGTNQSEEIMKIRKAFVSNSSSCSFTIQNLSDQKKTLADFARENDHLRLEFMEQYSWHSIDYDEMIESAEKANIIFAPGRKRPCVFGDEDGTIIGQVYDYQLRDGGESENFRWEFVEFLR